MAKKKAAKNEGSAVGAKGVEGGSDVASLGKAEVMRRKLAKQEKVAIMIPLSPGEREGSTDTVILNGYRINIRKGSYLYVPKQVAEVVMESQQMTEEAIRNYFLMDSSGKSKAMKEKDAEVISLDE